MPCCLQYAEADNMRVRKRYYADQKQAEETASRLRDWLITVSGSESKREHTEVGKLCETIRRVGEERMLEICRDRFSESEARELAGWWETHKQYDAERTEAQ